MSEGYHAQDTRSLREAKANGHEKSGVFCVLPCVANPSVRLPKVTPSGVLFDVHFGVV